MKPELLAVRAINQYRRRDVLAYLGLRYYLDNDCAKNDIWARDISTHLVKTRESPVYFRSYHFKEMAEGDINVVHRNIYLPGPNEILAESALLYDCSAEPAFQSSQCVYSYRFSELSSKQGIFQNYFPGFQERNNSIAKVCNSLNSTDAIVRYTDIKKFYPTISHELALQAWKSTCESSNISATSRELGERLLTQHAETAKEHKEGLGILTGPMFSHLIANLILANVDKLMFKNMGGKYWRYVDDFVLIGSVGQVESSRKLLNTILSDMGFKLHDERKDFEVKLNEWLEESNSLEYSMTNRWTTLIANIKRFLIANPEQKVNLEQAFSQVEVNISLLDYSNAVVESSYRQKFSDWFVRYSWFPNSIRVLTIDKLVRDAVQARNIYYQHIKNILNGNNNFEGYKRKQLISKLRFYARRLSYLATSDTLSSLSSTLSIYPELSLQARVMSAIHSRDVSLLVKYGTDAVQAAAQILRIKPNAVTCSLHSFGEVELQGLAILRLNGIEIKFRGDVNSQTIIDPLNQFALNINSAELMKSNNLFIKEIACLRGVESLSRHKYMLDNAFDRDEQLSLDIIDQLQAYSYF
ncbi:MAG TPA: RNA-directed DNA polymerase [Oculatellaceae cyanobacterium]|jgi:hypothetical protein